MGLLEGLKARGLRVPEDVALVGYDGMPESAYSDPALSTVKQPLFKMGFEAVRLVRERLENPATSFQRVVLAPELIRRKSS